MRIPYVLLVVTVTTCAAVSARAQLLIGHSGVVGFHSDFRVRPLNYSVGVLLTDSRNGTGAAIAVTPGLGYAKAVTPRLYLGAEAGVRVAAYRRDGPDGGEAPGLEADASATVGLAAYVSTSKRNRDFFKLGLPVVRSTDRFFSPVTFGLVSLFGRKDDEAPARTRGPVTDQPGAFYLEGRYGGTFGARGGGFEVGYGVGRFDLGVGLLARSTDDAPWSWWREARATEFAATGSAAVTVRRRGAARTQLMTEVLLPIDAERDRNGRRLRGGGLLALRYEQPLAGRLAVGVEAGLACELVSRRNPDVGSDTQANVMPHGALGLRYRLGGKD